MISFVILHYQAVDETISCIETIIEKVSGNKKVIVVDNGSPNGTGELLQEKYKGFDCVCVVSTKKNLGFAKGNNIGFQEAKKDNPDFIVVMNNDVFLKQDDFTDRVYAAYNNSKFDILGPDIFSTKTNDHQNPQREQNYTLEELKAAQRKLRFKDSYKWMLRIKYLFPLSVEKPSIKEHYTKERKTGVVLHGACYIFSKSFIERHNECFYGKTFMYYESYILHYLAQMENLHMVYEPAIQVLHHEDVATNLSYTSRYSKSVFVNKCLLDSCEAFIVVMQDRTKMIG